MDVDGEVTFERVELGLPENPSATFVIFDLEAVFVFAWAIAGRELGWAGYAGLLVFLLVLAVALIYEWRLGALDWVTQRRIPERGDHH